MRDRWQSATGAWATADVRRRWRSLVALGLLVGVTAGFATAAYIGARRSDSSLERLRAQTDAADVTVFASQAGYTDPDWHALGSDPHVRSLGVWQLVFGQPTGDNGDGVLFASDGSGWFTDVNRPLVTKGRMWDADAAGEVVVSEPAAAQNPLGSSFDVKLYAADQFELTGEATGPTVTLTVVGVVRTVNQFLFTPGQVFLSPAFLRAYGDQTIHVPNADVKLRDPTADVPAFSDAVQQIVGPGTPVFDINAVARRVDTTTSVESTALTLLAGAVAIAGGLLVAQAVARSASAVEEDAGTLAAMGMSTREITSAGVLAHIPALGVAAITTVVTAVLASRWFPVGLSRRIDPDVGLHPHWATVLTAAALTVLLTALGVVLIAHRAAVPRRAGVAHRTRRFVRALRRQTPVPIALGTTMAFDAGSGSSRLPVRPALLACTVGVLGVVATLTIDHGLDDTLAHPERAGVVWDLAAGYTGPLPPDQPLPADLVTDATEAAGPGTKTADMMRTVTGVGGVGVQTLTARPTGTDEVPAVQLTVTEGRQPQGAGEIAIGPRTARDTGAAIGDEITVDGLDHPSRIVGIALFPPEVHGGFDEGALVPVADFDTIATSQLSRANGEGTDVYIERWLAIDLPRGADVDARQADVEAAIGDRVVIGPPDTPLELSNLRNVRTLPFVLAAFLAALAVASMAHVFASSVRRRRHDFAVLRALGLGRRSSRLVLNAQGTAIALVGLLLGIPLGTVVGRRGWRLVTDQVPLEYVPPFALVAILVSIPLALLIVNAMAVWPGRLVARMRIADQLRTE